MNYNPTPKSEFAKDPTVSKEHRELVTNPDVRLGLFASLAEYNRRLAELNPQDLGSAAMLQMRSKGAHELVDIFLNLAESPAPVHVLDTSNLPGNHPKKQ